MTRPASVNVRRTSHAPLVKRRIIRWDRDHEIGRQRWKLSSHQVSGETEALGRGVSLTSSSLEDSQAPPRLHHRNSRSLPAETPAWTLLPCRLAKPTTVIAADDRPLKPNPARTRNSVCGRPVVGPRTEVLFETLALSFYPYTVTLNHPSHTFE